MFWLLMIFLVSFLDGLTAAAVQFEIRNSRKVEESVSRELFFLLTDLTLT